MSSTYPSLTADYIFMMIFLEMFKPPNAGLAVWNSMSQFEVMHAKLNIMQSGGNDDDDFVAKQQTVLIENGRNPPRRWSAQDSHRSIHCR